MCAPSPTASAVHNCSRGPVRGSAAPRRSTHDTDPAAHPDHRPSVRRARPGPARPAPLAEAGDYDAGLLALAAVQEQFYDQLDANGEGGGRVRLALALAPVDATGLIGSRLY